ncbi:MAG TPA: putative porin [Woeseiaceae bacterium]|nr:putative porin [Woeseiaceae bacterium]
MKAKIAVPLMLFSTIVAAEEYRSFSTVDYSHSETDFLELDQFSLTSTWFFDDKATLGPLKEFEYINRTSNVFGRYSRFDSGGNFYRAAVGGEYFAGNWLLGGSYDDGDGPRLLTGTVGYLFSEDFLLSVDAVKLGNLDTDLVLDARYNHRLGGNDYIGFNLRVDDDFDSREIASKYFTRLAGDTWLAVGLAYNFIEGAEDPWSVTGDYYFSERTSVALGVGKHDRYSLGLSHFFNRNVALELGYSTMEVDVPGSSSLDEDVYRAGVTIQF